MLLSLPDHINTLVIPLSHTLAKAEYVGPENRVIYFETSREGVIDRQGEDIAADSLWDSRQLFLDQGNFDISHFSFLGNPPGTGMRPEYVIGQPLNVKRVGKSIFVHGAIFSPDSKPPAGSDGEWANRFWFSLKHLNPPRKWFPSIYATLAKNQGQIEIRMRKGKPYRFIKGPLEWRSVGFASRVQHPELGPISIDPISPFSNNQVLAKAVMGTPAIQNNIAYIPYTVLAKAMMTAGGLAEGHEAAVQAVGGVAALKHEALDGATSARDLYARLKVIVLKKIMSKKIEATEKAVTEAFKKAGAGKYASQFTRRLDAEIHTALN